MAAKQYRVKGKRVPSVSTICKHMEGSNDGLIWWANQQGLEGRTLDEARDEVAGIGTIAHACIEADIKNTIDGSGGEVDMSSVPEHMRVAVEMSLSAWEQWKRAVKPEFLASEMSLVSEEFRFGGTLDFVAIVSGQVTLGDVKTGKLYPSALAQIGGYSLLWNEKRAHCYDPIARLDLLRLDKETGALTWKTVPDPQPSQEAFKLCRRVYDAAKELKKVVS